MLGDEVMERRAAVIDLCLAVIWVQSRIFVWCIWRTITDGGVLQLEGALSIVAEDIANTEVPSHLHPRCGSPVKSRCQMLDVSSCVGIFQSYQTPFSLIADTQNINTPESPFFLLLSYPQTIANMVSPNQHDEMVSDLADSRCIRKKLTIL